MILNMTYGTAVEIIQPDCAVMEMKTPGTELGDASQKIIFPEVGTYIVTSTYFRQTQSGDDYGATTVYAASKKSGSTVHRCTELDDGCWLVTTMSPNQYMFVGTVALSGYRIGMTTTVFGHWSVAPTFS